MDTAAEPIGRLRLARTAALVLLPAALSVFLIGSVTPGRADDTPQCPAKETVETLDPTQPFNLGQLKRQLFQYKCFRYDADVAAVLDLARVWIKHRAPQVARPAIVLDIDETSLSNWPEIVHSDYGYIPDGICDLASKWACGARAWELSGQAAAIAPTRDLFDAAKAKSVAVFFVTGRREDPQERGATEANLRKAGYDGWTQILLRPPASSGSVCDYKSSERAAIESMGYIIIANIGDQQSDL